MLMICTGQKSDASSAQAARSSLGVPSALLPFIRYFSMIRLHRSQLKEKTVKISLLLANYVALSKTLWDSSHEFTFRKKFQTRRL